MLFESSVLLTLRYTASSNSVSGRVVGGGVETGRTRRRGSPTPSPISTILPLYYLTPKFRVPGDRYLGP